MFLAMHSISGALRLLSPSSDKSLTSEPEPDEKIEEFEDNEICPHCHLNYDRVPPLPDGEHRRSSANLHSHGSRDISPRNKASAIEIFLIASIFNVSNLEILVICNCLSYG